MKDVWKKFEEDGLTHSSIHHLMAIYNLLKENGYARGIDIANHLHISRSSVSVTINKLIAKGFVEEDQNKFYHFTGKGEKLINAVLSKRRILHMFFREVLNLPEETAEEDACKIEHLLTQETGEKLMNFIGFFLSDEPVAKNFKDHYKEFIYECSTVDECEICANKCYLAGKKHP
jgi:DtxR family Mn-dependent transcriptional regulator